MKSNLSAIAVAGALSLTAPSAPAQASIETPEAKASASQAAAIARQEMMDAFGARHLKPGQFLWAKAVPAQGPAKIVIGLSDQLAYVYRGDQLVAVSTVSTGRNGYDTPTGIFGVLEKKKFHRSIKYENAPMPHMQRIDRYGIALHAGALPGYPASHGCIRLPSQFAAKLFSVTPVGTPVLIGS